MSFDLQWLLLALPVAFALGWLASRFDLRQMRREQRGNPRPFFEGLNLLLNEQQDKAIDAFIEAVQNDPDTAELHFALGNLFAGQPVPPPRGVRAGRARPRAPAVARGPEVT